MLETHRLSSNGALPEWLTGAPAIHQHRVWSLTACVRIAQASKAFCPAPHVKDPFPLIVTLICFFSDRHIEQFMSSTALKAFFALNLSTTTPINPLECTARAQRLELLEHIPNRLVQIAGDSLLTRIRQRRKRFA